MVEKIKDILSKGLGLFADKNGVDKKSGQFRINIDKNGVPSYDYLVNYAVQTPDITFNDILGKKFDMFSYNTHVTTFITMYAAQMERKHNCAKQDLSVCVCMHPTQGDILLYLFVKNPDTGYADFKEQIKFEELIPA